MAAPKRSTHTGIDVRHLKACATKSGGVRCTCSPTYRAKVFDVRHGRELRKSFPTLALAKAWRAEATTDLRSGRLSAAPTVALEAAAQAWLDGVRSGAIRNRSGDVYKPSAIRGYEQALRLRVLPEFGHARLGDLRRADLQEWVDRLLANGSEPSTIRNTLIPLRVIFRRAMVRGEVSVNPTVGLELPAVRGRRERIATPAEAEALLSALKQDRALWATAMYAGLRLGELRALRWKDVDFDTGRIRVTRSWDPREGLIEPKSRAGRRTVPLASVLRAYLVEQRLACAWREGLVFGRSPARPFLGWTPYMRSRRVWETAGMKPIGFHECRHTFASFMIAAGVNAKALSVYMGHSSVMITFDLYGHLMPGNEVEAAGLLDAYLDRARGSEDHRDVRES